MMKFAKKYIEKKKDQDIDNHYICVMYIIGFI